MNCKQVSEKLLFFLDNELAEKERRELKLHLAVCSACQKKLKDLENAQGLLSQGFDSIKRETAPSWLWMELEQRMAISNEDVAVWFSRAKTRLKTFIGRQPGWKLALVGVLSIAVITISVIFVPLRLSPSPEARASEVAFSTPEVRALAGGTPLLEAIQVSDNTGYVLSKGAAGQSTLACVDLQQSSVERLLRLPIPPLTEDDKNQSLSIARADPRIQQILESGGTISVNDMFPLPPRLRLEIVDGQPVVWSEGTLVGAVIRMKSLVWVVQINLDKGKVFGVSMMAPPSQTQAVKHPGISSSQEEVTEIAESDIRVKALLDQGAKIDHVALGSGGMDSSGAMILTLGQEVWCAKVDLNSHTVTHVDLVPQARCIRTNLFNLESGS